MQSSYEQEFYRRIKHDFKKYVMLTSNQIHLNENYILQFVYNLEGYKCHKTVKYEDNTSHIIVKFEDDYYSMEAVARLNFQMWPLGITANLLHYMLKDWFQHEKLNSSGDQFSLTIAEITKTTPYNLNLLKDAKLNAIFKNFGKPLLLGHGTLLKKRHAIVLFRSMTEALAASIYFGEWYFRDRKSDWFSFRVRIVPLNMEGSLIQNVGVLPQEAFKLNYFLNGIELERFLGERNGGSTD